MASLTPCRFFAAGTCRFGNNCRFYHEQRNQQPAMGTGNVFFGNRTLAPPTFQPQSAQLNQAALNLSAKTGQTVDQLVEQVKKDMQEWQGGQIWPYSCYGPLNGKVCLPGFEDVSPEELRLTFVQCGNTLPPEILQRLQLQNQFRLNYQQYSNENRSAIERLLSSDMPIPTSTLHSSFGGLTTASQTPASIFGGGVSTQQQQQAGSIFGGGTAQSQQPGGSIFGGGGTAPQQQPGGIFGGGVTPQQQGASIFGNPPAFGAQLGQPAGAGLFQSQAAPPPSQGLFTPQNPSQPGFPSTVQQPGLFQQSNQVFQGQGSQPASHVFQQPNQPGLFNQAAAPPSVSTSHPSFFHTSPPVQTQPTPGQFQHSQAQQQQPASIFPTNPQQGAVFPPGSGNIFGGNPVSQVATNSSIFGGSTAQFATPQQPGLLQPGTAGPGTQKFIYSAESELAPEELEAFRAVEFTIDSLPVNLPPQSACI